MFVYTPGYVITNHKKLANVLQRKEWQTMAVPNANLQNYYKKKPHIYEVNR